MARDRRAAGRRAREARGVVRRGAQGLGHLARSPVFRLRDPRRARQVLLCVVRRADRLSGKPACAMRPDRSRFRRLHAARKHRRALSFHRQGHQLLPHALLARRAAGLRLSQTDGGVCTRLPDRERPEDVEVAGHFHHGASLPRSSARRTAALLFRGQARPGSRRHRPEPRRPRRARELRHRRQARQHREPLRRLRHACRRHTRGEPS